MSDIEPIIDPSGALRRCGTKPNPDGFTTKLRMYADVHPMYTRDQIKAMITDPNRVRSRERFGADWILDQRSHGSCEGHMEAGMLQRARVRRGLKKLLLSGAYAYSKVNGGGDNGAVLEDGLAAIQQYGICPADLVTWDMIYPHLQPANADAEAAKHKADEAFALPDEDSLLSALAAGFDCGVAIMAGNNFMRLNGDGISGADGGGGNHAVCLDDVVLIHDQFEYDLANSWNTTFGIQGRTYINEAHLRQTRQYNTFYCVAGTIEAGE